MGARHRYLKTPPKDQHNYAYLEGFGQLLGGASRQQV